MKVKSYVSRLGYGDLIKVANNKTGLGSDKDLLQANYQCFHDLVLNATGGDALEILSSCGEETFTPAWVKTHEGIRDNNIDKAQCISAQNNTHRHTTIYKHAIIQNQMHGVG